MNRIFNIKFFSALLGLLLIVTATDTFAQKKKPVLRRKKPVAHRVVRKPTEPLYMVNAGTVMRVRINQTISSKTARAGDRFTVTVTEPVYSSNGVIVVPVGSTLTGKVNSVRPGANQGKPGQIDASFVQLRLPNGRTRYINGSLTDLNANGVRSDNESTASGKPMQNRKLIFIGGGAVGGTILGGAIGGGKGAAIGALLGAGGGFLGDRYTKGKEAEVQAGTEFGVYLNLAISLPRFGETTPTPTPVRR
jgi:hypothetical protein